MGRGLARARLLLRDLAEPRSTGARTGSRRGDPPPVVRGGYYDAPFRAETCGSVGDRRPRMRSSGSGFVAQARRRPPTSAEPRPGCPGSATSTKSARHVIDFAAQAEPLVLDTCGGDRQSTLSRRSLPDVDRSIRSRHCWLICDSTLGVGVGARGDSVLGRAFGRRIRAGTHERQIAARRHARQSVGCRAYPLAGVPVRRMLGAGGGSGRWLVADTSKLWAVLRRTFC